MTRWLRITGDKELRGSNRRVGTHFVEIDHEIFSFVILSIYLVTMPYTREDILGFCAVEQSKYVTRKDESMSVSDKV